MKNEKQVALIMLLWHTFQHLDSSVSQFSCCWNHLCPVNSFMTEVSIIQKPVHWSANQWIGFYMISTSVMKELNLHYGNDTQSNFSSYLHDDTTIKIYQIYAVLKFTLSHAKTVNSTKQYISNDRSNRTSSYFAA